MYEKLPQNNEFQPNSPTAQQPNKVNFKSLVYFLFLFFVSSQFIYPQCNINTVTGAGTFSVQTSSSYFRIGQTFEACESGVITSIKFGFGPGTLASTNNLRIGTSTNPPTALLSSPVNQTFTTSGGAEILTINLTNPFSVISGMIYAVEFEATPDNTINYFTNTTNNYAEGQFYSNESGFTPEPIIDLDFEVCVNGCPSSSPPAGIPTLSEWGLLILALLLMTFGTLYLVQSSVRHSFEQER